MSHELFDVDECCHSQLGNWLLAAFIAAGFALTVVSVIVAVAASLRQRRQAAASSTDKGNPATTSNSTIGIVTANLASSDVASRSTSTLGSPESPLSKPSARVRRRANRPNHRARHAAASARPAIVTNCATWARATSRSPMTM